VKKYLKAYSRITSTKSPSFGVKTFSTRLTNVNPLNAELNPICHLLALLGAHLIFHVSGLRVKVPPPQSRYFSYYINRLILAPPPL
jgi:hypothetical protein